MESEEPTPHPISAEEYAKVRAVLERIEGLRRAMVAIIAIGLFCSFLAWFLSLVSYIFAYPYSSNPVNPFYSALVYAVLVFIPFLLLTGYFSYRVNRHIERLSRGKYEPPRIIE